MLDRAATVALAQVDQLVDRLREVAETGGVGLQALLGGGQAAVAGRSPVWGALKAGFGALSVWAKIGVIVAVVLVLVLGLVLAVLVLLAVIIAAIVAAARSGQQ